MEPHARVEGILTALQNRSDGLQDIRCEVRFVEEDRVNLTKRTKAGRILFLMTQPNAQFLIHFDKTETDDVLGRQEWYLFDGRWLYQTLERVEQVTKQEVARAGEKLDLFDIEKAPFPVPFGQNREKILRNFDVNLVAPAAGDPPNTDHLVCTPKKDSRLARKYDKLELFVDRELYLPTRIVVTKNTGLEVNTADFPGLSVKSINTGVSPKDLEKPAAWKKYKEVVEDLVPTER
jgi:outer membrane lipoprotein-sorting protein